MGVKVVREYRGKREKCADGSEKQTARRREHPGTPDSPRREEEEGRYVVELKMEVQVEVVQAVHLGQNGVEEDGSSTCRWR